LNLLACTLTTCESSTAASAYEQFFTSQSAIVFADSEAECE